MTTSQIVKVFIIGPMGSGKTTFVNTIAENDVYEKIFNSDGRTIGNYFYAQLSVDDSLVLNIYCPRKFDMDFLHEILGKNVLGLIIVMDSADIISFYEVQTELNTVRAYMPIPYIVAANKQDHSDAWDIEALRIVFHLSDEVPLIPYVGTDLESVKNVLLALCDEALKWLDQIESEPSSK